jgi:flagellar motor switch protein FliM
MFKLEPLRGVGVLAVPSTLGLGIVDRLMGGAGTVPEESREMSEIERALLEQAVQVVLNEWCAHWAKQKEVRPAMLGYETNGHFLQIAHPEAIMLLVCTEIQIGEATSKVGIAMPYSSLEPLIRQVAQNTRPATENPTPVNPATLRWNACLNEARMPITAEWEGIEMRAGDIINLKPGDVLPLDPALVQNVTVRLGDLHKFIARPGNVAGQRAIELTAIVKK